MTFPRRALLLFPAFAGLLLLASGARATDISMANGTVSFSVPADWLDIMQTDGDPEVRVFQVPDTSATGKVSLARVTVTVKQIVSPADYQQFISDATAKAATLPGYQAAKGVVAGADGQAYTAKENGVDSSYRERYWMKGGEAIQLRCVRPEHSDAGEAWKAAFDHGCDAIAARLK